MVRSGHDFLRDNPVYLMEELLQVQLCPNLYSTKVGESVRNRVRFSTIPVRKNDEMWLCDELVWPNVEPARQSGFLLKAGQDTGENVWVGM